MTEGSFSDVRNLSSQPSSSRLLQYRVQNHTRDAIIVDGSALVNSLPPRTSKTFEGYAASVVLPTIIGLSLSIKHNRTDIVFDVYQSSSLKAETRSKRGHGVRRRVTSTGKIPSNWQSFTRNNDNKTELFNFLAEKLHRCVCRTWLSL